MSGIAAEFIQAGIQRVTQQKCLVCGGSGQSPIGMPGMAELKPGCWACTCEAGRALLVRWQAVKQKEATNALLKGADIPAKFQDCTLETFRQRVRLMQEKVSAARQVQEWLDGQEKPWLFLWGPTGRGKTGLGVAALKVLVQRLNVAGRFISTFDMFDEMKARFGGNVEEYAGALASVPVLMVDELVTPFQSSWRTQVLFELVWHRDAAQLPTIWTCADEKRIVESVTEAGWRRIRDNSVRVELKGKEIDWGK